MLWRIGACISFAPLVFTRMNRVSSLISVYFSSFELLFIFVELFFFLSKLPNFLLTNCRQSLSLRMVDAWECFWKWSEQNHPKFNACVSKCDTERLQLCWRYFKWGTNERNNREKYECIQKRANQNTQRYQTRVYYFISTVWDTVCVLLFQTQNHMICLWVCFAYIWHDYIVSLRSAGFSVRARTHEGMTNSVCVWLHGDVF